MKPIQITMQAFGSYIGNTTVDFTKLGDHPLFLITGATGGGKTTILDAMCFALYCKATGGRRSWSSMVSAAAPQDAETLVDFVFSLGGETYRFFRSRRRYAARGTGALKVREEHSCYRRNGAEWELILTGAESKVREQAEKLLGLNCEQFSQVTVLPQGDFLRLLLANSRDKAQMFQTLFATERWSAVTRKLKDMADELEQKVRDLTAEKDLTLEREGVSTAEELEHKCAQQGGELESVRAQLVLLRKEQEQKNGALNRALALGEKFQSAKALSEELHRLIQREEEMGRKRAALKQSRLARTVLPYFSACGSAERDRKEKARVRKAAQAALAAAQKEETRARAESARIKPCREAATALAQRLSGLASLKKSAERLKAIRDEWKEKQEKLDRRREMQKALTKDLDDAQNRFRVGRQYLQKAQEENRRLPALMEQVQRIMDGNRAAALALGLKEGVPCPVCGAVHHPAPAKPSDRLNGAQEELKKAKASASMQEKYEARLAELEQLQETARAKLKEGESLTAALEKEADSLQAAADEVKAGLGVYGETGKIEREIAELTRKIRENTALADRLERRAAEARSALAAAQAADGAAAQALEQAERTEREARETFLEQAKAAGFPPAADFSGLVLSPERETELEKEWNDFTASRRAKQERLDELERELAGGDQPDLAGRRAEYEQVRRACEEAAQRAGSLAQSAASAERSLQRLRELEQTGGGLERRFSRTSRLAQLLAGKNGMKIPIQQFILGIMLDDILTAANQTFSTLSAGRYSLSRVQGAGTGNAYGGLDLQVFDAYSGGARGVETLSGGELFLASLSLAFGLSDVVQNYSGSVHLDSIFIDEGFGSLDQETLDTAMKALRQVQKNGRTIGIISHVSELKARIAAQIIVSRGPDGGSRVEIVS